MFERGVRWIVFAGIGVVLLGGAGLAWTAQRRLLSDRDLTGDPCPALTHEEALRLRLSFPSATSEDRTPVNGILVNTIETRKRCVQILGHASCGLDGAGYTRVHADDRLAYFSFAAGQAALLDVRGGVVRCVLAPREVVDDRFG